MPEGNRSLRAVYDTNVLISALVFDGEVRELWNCVESGRVILCLSRFIVDEFASVALRLGSPPGKTGLLVSAIMEHALVVAPKMTVDFIKADISDNQVLACALECDADVIVTAHIDNGLLTYAERPLLVMQRPLRVT
jgi:putative PIN family toxin of toxin-antitoxin system